LRIVTAASKTEDAWARAALEFSAPEVQEPETQAATDCEARLAVEMLRALPHRQRETITLTFEGYTPTEIASLLGTDRNAVRVNLHHARAKLITRMHQSERLLRIQKSASRSYSA
jgi:RNA polymerase sigma factor (sigma-70 family)